jgi:hypothetical protein
MALGLSQRYVGKSLVMIDSRREDDIVEKVFFVEGRQSSKGSKVVSGA